MKKRIAGMMTGILALCMLAGCGNDAGKQDTDTQAVSAAEEQDSGAQGKDGEAGGNGGEETRLLVAAAASLKNVYDEKLIPMFEEANPGIVVEGTYDSSGKLQTQIEEGLEADVFMSAAPTQMNALNDGGMILTETMTELLENKIVLIVPKGSDLGLASFTDITKASAIALGDPASVPVGQYSQEALTNLGVWEEIQDRVSLGTNVTEVLNQVAAGSADAGIVYATDAASMPEQVEVVAEAPAGSVSRAIYPVAVVKNTAHAEEAERFVEFLGSPEAMEVFEEYGFADARAGAES